MTSKIRTVFLICIAVFASAVLFKPLITGTMQQPDKENKTQQALQQEKALQEIKDNPVAVAFFEKLQRYEPQWTMTEAFDYSHSKEDIVKTDSVQFFQVNGVEVRVILKEYKNAESALNSTKSSVRLSGGFTKKVQGIGDEAKKIYLLGQGTFSNLSFRKAAIFASISCDSEATAEQFAKYIVEIAESQSLP